MTRTEAQWLADEAIDIVDPETVVFEEIKGEKDAKSVAVKAEKTEDELVCTRTERGFYHGKSSSSHIIFTLTRTAPTMTIFPCTRQYLQKIVGIYDFSSLEELEDALEEQQDLDIWDAMPTWHVNVHRDTITVNAKDELNRLKENPRLFPTPAVECWFWRTVLLMHEYYKCRAEKEEYEQLLLSNHFKAERSRRTTWEDHLHNKARDNKIIQVLPEPGLRILRMAMEANKEIINSINAVSR